MKMWLVMLMAAIAVTPAIAAEGTAPAAPTAKTISVEVSDKPVADVLKQMASDAGVTILAEKLVTGNVTVSVKDVTLEKALGAVTKAAGAEWMKVYAPDGSTYVKDGDALAAQVRLLLGLHFPDIVIAPSASYAPVVHLQKDSTAGPVVSKIGKGTGLIPVYLVTNDKAYTKKVTKEQANSKAKRYKELTKEQMDLFLSMTPEERAEAMKVGMQMAMQMDPQAMADMMRSVFEADPQAMTEMNARGMQAIMSMDPEARKNMLRMSMRSQVQMWKNMDPAQMQQFMKEAAEVAKEMQQSGEMPAPPGMPLPKP